SVDIFAYPVSLVMKFWHWALGFVVDPDSGIAWVGSVLLLVVTVRLLLLRSMWRQQYSMRKMAQLAPKMKELQNKYKDRKSPEDKQEQAKEMQALYSGAGVNPADRKSTRLNSSHVSISYAVFCLKKKK